MKKIYNNLTVENLTKTDWFNQFDKGQQEQIKLGLEKNLDVSIYAKKEYSWEQMEQIRWGLEANLDVSIYAKPNISHLQMDLMREKLLEEL